jgi:hypothetical protein
MNQRRCRYCQCTFQPSKFQPHQEVCSRPECQRQRRADYHRAKLATDPEYGDVCRDSARKWREQHPGYWKQYRQSHPAAAEQNRIRQQVRDRRQRLRHLANNNSALDLKRTAAEVWLVTPGASGLANNNSAPAQVWIIEALPPRAAVPWPSCKQHPSGPDGAPAA